MPLLLRRLSPSAVRVNAAAACLFAVLALAAPDARAAGAEFTPAQRQGIEAIVHDYLKQHPEVLLDALKAAEDKLKADAHDQAQAALVKRKQEIFDDPQTPVGGNPEGDVSLVEFFDYRCPYCKEVEPSLEALTKTDKQLRFVYKEFPVLGPASVTAARVALAAREQGKYADFRRAMMAVKGNIEDATVFKVAAAVGLDIDRLKRDMNDPGIDRDLKANDELAKELDIRGTPGFVIGQTIVPGAISLAELKKLILAARKK